MKTLTAKIKPRKSGVVAYLKSKGFEKMPNALAGVIPAENFTQSEVEFGEYLIYDSDFGGAWDDADQINAELV